MKIKENVKNFENLYEDHAYRFESLPGISQTWQPAKLVKFYELVHKEPKMPQEIIATELQISVRTVQRKNSSMDWELFDAKLYSLCNTTDKAFFVENASTYRLESLAKSTLNIKKNLIQQQASEQALHDKILNGTVPIEYKLPPFSIQKKKTKDSKPEVAVLLLSDLHVGQEFSESDTGGLNAYNPKIFLKRANNLRKSLIDLITFHESGHHIEELYVLSLGDCVHGTNLGGEWGPAYTSLDIHEQTLVASNTISSMLMDWSGFFNKVHFYGVVGNHGRAGQSKNSDKISANFDNIIYDLVEGKTKANPKIIVDTNKSWWRQLNINGLETMIVHGDNLACNVNSLQKEEQRLQALLTGRKNKFFNLLCMGHFHNHMELETTRGTIMVNGSFVGGDIYSMNKLRTASRPSQTLFGVHLDNGITWKYKIDLDIEK